MGKIDKFLAKSAEIMIGEERFNITPFTVGDMPMLQKMGSKDPEKSSEAVQEAVYRVFKQIDPECTKEQVLKVSVEYLEDIMKAIGKLNNIDMDDPKVKAKLLKDGSDQ